MFDCCSVHLKPKTTSKLTSFHELMKMEQSFADLLSGAFSDDVVAETSAPSFSDGDLDFENLNFTEEDNSDISAENLQTKEDNTLHQEATSQTTFLLSMESADVNMTENDDKDQSDEEDFQVEGVMSLEKTLAEDCTSSEGDSERAGSVSEEDEENEEEDIGEPGDLMMLVCSSGNKEDRIFAEGQPLAPQGAENTQDRNEEQGDEEVSYFERVPERGGEIGIKGDESEDDEREIENAKQVDTCDSKCEGMKFEQEEEQVQFYKRDAENPARDDHDNEEACLEFPEITVQNQQALLAEVESKECWEKVEDFSGEEHQEAGETFADYPSDLSSCEYVEENQGSYHQQDGSSSVANQDAFLERARTDSTCMGRGEDTYEEGEEHLYSRNLEEDDGKFMYVASGEKERGELEIPKNMLGIDEGETDESDSSSSSLDEYKEKWTYEEHDIYTVNAGLRENNKEHEETQIPSGDRTAFARWDTSNDYHRADLDMNWNLDELRPRTLQSEDLLTTEDADIAETLLSDLTGPQDVNNYLAVQREEAKNTSSSSQGSLDDGFFFTTDLIKPYEVIEPGQQVDDEYEEDRNWDQEQERIKAFFKFYDDSDREEGREGRQSKVQFCTNPLSQVIHFETDSERESLSSSTEGEEDRSSGETSEESREPENDNMEMIPGCDLPNTEITENVPDLRNTPKSSRKHKRLNMLKMTLKMAVVILTGLVMLWLVTDQEAMFSPLSFF
ncbi:enolase-phosphatase E1 isoform X1 [Labrus bergylta]|uniref:enolase-phosphatase E1 isoform X1 n=2 Tax=Labrus bergylta TaxID=56723 RepID=UPI003313F9B0